jgi:hypothetical protein
MSLIRNNRLLWTLQVLLALLFLFAGVAKLMMPADQLTAQGPAWLSASLLQFVSVMEILGALGLVLPGLFGIRPELTPLAAGGLVVIMIGAVVITALTMPPAMAILPFVTGVLAAVVVLGRRSTSSRPPQPARSY